MTVLITRRFHNKAHWLESLDQTYALAKTAGWEFLFTLRDGVAQFSKSDPERMTLLEDAANQIGLNVRTLQNYLSVARKSWIGIAVELDRDIGHAAAVQGLDDEIAEDVLRLSAERGLSVPETRKLAWANRHAVVNDDVPFSDPHSPLYIGGGPVRECPYCGRKLS